MITYFNSFGQKQANIWYFGNGAGLDFNQTCDPIVLTDGGINGFEGCATISDKLTGQLLFSTNSEWVWNRNQVIIPNSNLVANGNTITQVMIIPKPTFDSIYYIITSEVQSYSGQGYQFHSIDMTLNGGLGGIAFKDSLLYLSPVTEKITAISHANGTDIWIVGHQYNSNKFLSFLVTSSGINTTPVISQIGKINSDYSTSDAIGELKASPDGSKLASVTLRHPNIELFDFNNSTGQISNLISITENGGYDTISGCSGLYGLSFSPNNSLLYVSQWYAPSLGVSKIIQYNIASNDSTTINSSRINVFTSNESYYSLKLAPNGKIYVARNVNQNYIGVINCPDSVGLNCNYVNSGVYLGGKQSGWGLNNLMEYGIYCKPITTSINENEISKIKIYPNPFSTQTTLQTDNFLKDATLTVDNCFGQAVKQIKNIAGQTVVLSRDNLPRGMYFLRLTENNKTLTVDKLVITDK